MLKLVTWFLLLLEILASAENIKPRSVNIALETILDFDNKNKAADVKLIDDVQDFLNKVRNFVDKKPARRLYNSDASKMKFTEFVRELIELLKTYDSDDLEDIFAVIDDEIRKYHYKGCKFYELVEDPNLRRYVANKLNLVKEKPAKDIRWKLDGTLQAMEDAKLNSKQTDVLDYINSLFTRDDGLEFRRILGNLQTYRSKSKRANLDLVKLVRDSIRTVVFDKYSNLNPNTRRDFKIKLETFWQHWKQPKKFDYKVWNVNLGKSNNPFVRFSESNYKTTPFNAKDIFQDAFFLKQLITMTPFVSNDELKKERRKVRIKKGKKNMSRKEKPRKGNNEDRDIISAKHGKHKNNKGVDFIETLVSGNEDTDNESKSKNSRDIKQYKQSVKDSSSSEDDDFSKSVFDVTKKRENLRKKSKASTPIFAREGNRVRPGKIIYLSPSTNYGDESKKSKKQKKISTFVSLFSEKLTTKKRRFKIESTTRNNYIRMQTLWQENLEPILKKKKSKQAKNSNESYVVTKKPYLSRNRAHKHIDDIEVYRPKIKPRQSHKKDKKKISKDYDYNYLRSHQETKRIKDKKMENIEKTEYLKSFDEGISLKLAPQRKERKHKSQIRTQQNDNINEAKKIKRNKQKNAVGATDEELDIQERHKKVETSKEEIDTKRYESVLSPKSHIAKNSIKQNFAIKKGTIVEESRQTDLESTYERHKVLTEISDTASGSTSETSSSHQTEEKVNAFLRTHKTQEESTESESSCDSEDHSTSHEFTENETIFDKGKANQRSAKEEKNKFTYKKDIPQILPVEYIPTSDKIDIEPYEGTISPRPRYKVLDDTTIHFSPILNYARHRMVDNYAEKVSVTPKSLYAVNQNIKDSLSDDRNTLAERSTEYEVEEILSNNLYNKLNNKDLNEKQSQLSKEVIAIETHEKNMPKIFRKSNDKDNFTTTKGTMKRINLNYELKEAKGKSESAITEAKTLPVKQTRFPTLAYWEGTTRTTARFTETRKPHNIFTDKIPLKLATDTDKVTSKNYPHSQMDTHPNETQNTKVPVITSLATKDPLHFSKMDNLTVFGIPDLTAQKEIPSEFNMQDYFNKKIDNLEKYKANADNAQADISPFASFRHNDNLKVDKTLATPPISNITSQNHLVMATEDVNFAEKKTYDKNAIFNNLNSISPQSDVADPFADAANITAPTMEDISNLLDRYGLSSVPPLPSNFLGNNSMKRRTMPSTTKYPNEPNQDLEYSDLDDVDSIIDKYQYPSKNNDFLNETDITQNANETKADIQSTNTTKYRSFHDFMTDTTKAQIIPEGPRIGKRLRRKMMQMEYNEDMNNETRPLVDNYDIAGAFDLM